MTIARSHIMAVFGVLALVIVAIGALFALPTDEDHAQQTTSEFLADFADPPGQGPLDGIRFDTEMGVQGKRAELQDYLQFDHGLFMSRECTDRCNYPPSSYFARETVGSTEFIVEAFCPTKDTTMVWRGTITDNKVSGTVTWTTSRFYWKRTVVLEFNGVRSDLAARIVLE